MSDSTNQNIPKKRVKLFTTDGYKGANSTPNNNPYLAQPVKYHLLNDVIDDLDAIQERVEDNSFYILDTKKIPYEYEVYQIITNGTTGEAQIPKGAKIVLGKYAGKDNCLLVKVDEETFFPVDEPVEDFNNNIVTASLDEDGNYTMYGTPNEYPVALIYRIETTWEYLRYINFHLVVQEDRVQSALSVKYNNNTSKLLAKTVQDALDEIVKNADNLVTPYIEGDGISVVDYTITNTDKGSTAFTTHLTNYNHDTFLTSEDLPENLSNLDVIKTDGDGTKALTDDGDYKEFPDGSNWDNDGATHIKPKDGKKLKLDILDGISTPIADATKVQLGSTIQELGNKLLALQNSNDTPVDSSKWEADGVTHIKPKDSKLLKLSNLDGIGEPTADIANVAQNDTIQDIANKVAGLQLQSGGKVNALGGIIGATDVNLANGTFITGTLTGAIELTFTGLPETGYVKDFVLHFTNIETITFPVGTKFAGGVPPVVIASPYMFVCSVNSAGVVTVYSLIDNIIVPV